MQKVIVNPDDIANLFLTNLFGLSNGFRKGRQPLQDLISMFYQNSASWKENQKTVLEKHSINSLQLHYLTRGILKNAYQYAPDNMEEIVRHSLEKAAQLKEFVICATEWLHWHQLIIVYSPADINGFIHYYFRWIPIYHNPRHYADLSIKIEVE